MAVGPESTQPKKPVSFLDVLTPEQREFLHDCGKLRRFSRGSSLIAYGEVSGFVVILLKGRVKVVVEADNDRQSLLALRGPGAVLGEVSALDNEPHLASIVAIEPVEALIVSNADFYRLLKNSPEAALWIATEAVKRLRQSARGRVELGVSDTTARVARRIVELANGYGTHTRNGILIDTPLNQDELAAWCGTTRRGVSRALHVFRELGWIETEGRMITVHDLAALERRGS